MAEYQTQPFAAYAQFIPNAIVEAQFQPSGGGAATTIRAELEKIDSKLNANAMVSASAKAEPANNDQLPILDSAAAYGLKRLSILNLRNSFRAVFDTLYAAVSHVHPISAITNLQTTLNGKAALAHTHAQGDVTGLDTALAGKAALSHGHPISDVSGLQTSINGLQSQIDGKAASSHTHPQSDITGLVSALAGKAASSHTHAIANVTGLQTALDGKVPLSLGAFDIGSIVMAVGSGSTTPGDTVDGTTLTVRGGGTSYTLSGGTWMALGSATVVLSFSGGGSPNYGEAGLYRRTA